MNGGGNPGSGLPPYLPAMDYYAQGSLVAAVVALAIAVYLRAFSRGDREAKAFSDLSLVIFLWCFPEFLWKILSSDFWHKASLAGVMFLPPFALRYCGAAVRTRPRWFPAAFVAGMWVSAAFGVTLFYDPLPPLAVVERGGPPVRLPVPRHGPVPHPAARVPRLPIPRWNGRNTSSW